MIPGLLPAAAALGLFLTISQPGQTTVLGLTQRQFAAAGVHVGPPSGPDSPPAVPLHCRSGSGDSPARRGLVPESSCPPLVPGPIPQTDLRSVLGVRRDPALGAQSGIGRAPGRPVLPGQRSDGFLPGGAGCALGPGGGHSREQRRGEWASAGAGPQGALLGVEEHGWRPARPERHALGHGARGCSHPDERAIPRPHRPFLRPNLGSGGEFMRHPISWGRDGR